MKVTAVEVVIVLVTCVALAAFGYMVVRANDSQKRENVLLARRAWSGPCQDQAVLLGTPTGSPSDKRCPNRLHRMEVQVATHSSNEEAAALVFCRCLRAGDPGFIAPDGGAP